MVINGRVVAGMSGCYHLNTRCWVSAHDVETGQGQWRTHTIPGKGEFGYDSWGAIPDEDRRGGSAWNSPSYDPELNLIYTGVGVPIPWGSVQRGSGDGDVLYTNSTLALAADTGNIVWYFQHIPNDEWDLDHPFARLVLETEVSPGAVEWKNNAIIPGGRRRIVTGIPGKTGIVWALDAATGAFLWAQPTNQQKLSQALLSAFGKRGGESACACASCGCGCGVCAPRPLSCSAVNFLGRHTPHWVSTLREWYPQARHFHQLTIIVYLIL